MRDLMFGFTGSHRCLRHHLPPPLLHLCSETAQRSAPLIPAVGFYNSKDLFLLFFSLSTAELCRIRAALRRLSSVSNMAAVASALSARRFHVFLRLASGLILSLITSLPRIGYKRVQKSQCACN